MVCLYFPNKNLMYGFPWLCPDQINLQYLPYLTKYSRCCLAGRCPTAACTVWVDWYGYIHVCVRHTHTQCVECVCMVCLVSLQLSGLPTLHSSISVCVLYLSQLDYCCSALTWMTEALSQSNVIKADRPPPHLRGKVTRPKGKFCSV